MSNGDIYPGDEGAEQLFPGAQAFQDKPEFEVLIDMWMMLIGNADIDMDAMSRGEPTATYAETLKGVVARATEICDRSYPGENPVEWALRSQSAATAIHAEAGLSTEWLRQHTQGGLDE